jgi:hypothetical protein
MLEKEILIEAIGYLGSTLVLVSFLMASVFKLRVVNTVGSVIFTIYACIIHSYPTAIMNTCLVGINIYYLIKMNNTDKSYDLVKTDSDDSLLDYFIHQYRDDIIKIFPGINMDFSNANASYVICHEGKLVGAMLGQENNGVIEVLLDYTVPQYRDFSIGKFLFDKLQEEGIKSLTYRGSDENHKAYLAKTGFVNKGGYYEKTF